MCDFRGLGFCLSVEGIDLARPAGAKKRRPAATPQLLRQACPWELATYGRRKPQLASMALEAHYSPRQLSLGMARFFGSEMQPGGSDRNASGASGGQMLLLDPTAFPFAAYLQSLPSIWAATRVPLWKCSRIRLVG